MTEVRPTRNLAKLIAHFPIIFALFILNGILVAAAYMYLTEPKYRSEVIIEKGVRHQQAIAQINMPWAERSAMTEQIESPSFLTEALSKNESLLHTYYIQSDYRREQTRYRFPYEVKHRVVGNPAFSKQHYKIEPVSEKIYKLTADYNGIVRVFQGEFGKEIIENNLALTITPKEQTPQLNTYYVQAPEYSFSIESPAVMATRLLDQEGGVTASEQNGVISIHCTAGHPDKAKEIAESISSHLLGETTSNSSNEITGTQTSVLDQKIETISKSMEETESQIAAFKKAHHITDLNIDTETSMAVLKELQLQKTNLEMKLATLDNLSNYLRKNIDGNNAQVEYGTIEDPEFLAQITRLNELYKDNGEAASSSKEVRLLKASIAERILNTRKKTTVQLEGISMAINQNRKNLANVPEQAAALMALQRKLDLDKKVYDLLSEKRAQTIVGGGIAETTTGRIVRPATTPVTPVSPIWYMVSVAALLTATGLFWFIASLLERRKASRINVEQTSQPSQRIAFLGAVNHETGDPIENEALRTICARIMMIPDAQTLTVTSAGPSEGKTATAISLAQTLSAMDKKVLLIDMNLYGPSVASELSVNSTHTLADTLAGSCDIHDAIALTSRPNLEVLEAGNMIMGINTWLSSNRKEEILSTLKKHYDYIIIDTPGVKDHIDALPMIRISDITLFAVKAQSTRKESLVVAENLKETHNIENLFCVLTPSNPGRMTRNKRTGGRKINITRNTVEKPGLLKRIALWFY